MISHQSRNKNLWKLVRVIHCKYACFRAHFHKACLYWTYSWCCRSIALKYHYQMDFAFGFGLFEYLLEFYIRHSLPYLDMIWAFSTLELSKLQYFVKDLEKGLLYLKSLKELLLWNGQFWYNGSCLVIVIILIFFVVLIENLLVAGILIVLYYQTSSQE